MAKKKQPKVAKSFTEAIGGVNIFQNDIFNGLFGFALILFAIYLTIAMVSYFYTGTADQSLVLDQRPGEWNDIQHFISFRLQHNGSVFVYIAKLSPQ